MHLGEDRAGDRVRDQRGLISCGGSSTEAVSPGDVQLPPAGPDSPNCPVRNHFAEMDGRTRRGVQVPADYAFLEAGEGGCLPVRFNPCEPIHYTVNAALAPPGAVDDLHEVIRGWRRRPAWRS